MQAEKFYYDNRIVKWLRLGYHGVGIVGCWQAYGCYPDLRTGSLAHLPLYHVWSYASRTYQCGDLCICR